MKTYTKLLVVLLVVCFTSVAWSYDINLPKKWSQPIVEWPDLPGYYYGWDEVSIDPEPIVADDWECRTDLPVIGIHWWGSYQNWMQEIPPSFIVAPNAFLIQFWTNVPVDDPTNTYGFSHPRDPIHTIYCDVYDEEFVGYDMDPYNPGIVLDATFQYSQIFPETEWFWQDSTGTDPAIYWVSIQAIYEAGIADPYPWGWKTRPWYFEDDAVRSSPVFPGWEPIEGPDGVSWDMAFELYTIPEPGFAIVCAFAISLMMRRKT